MGLQVQSLDDPQSGGHSKFGPVKRPRPSGTRVFDPLLRQVDAAYSREKGRILTEVNGKFNRIASGKMKKTSETACPTNTNTSHVFAIVGQVSACRLPTDSRSGGGLKRIGGFWECVPGPYREFRAHDGKPAANFRGANSGSGGT